MRWQSLPNRQLALSTAALHMLCTLRPPPSNPMTWQCQHQTPPAAQHSMHSSIPACRSPHPWAAQQQARP